MRFPAVLALIAMLLAPAACQSISADGLEVASSTAAAAPPARQTAEVFTPDTVAIGSGLNVDIYDPNERKTGLFALVANRQGAPKAPVVIYVHGGGWIKGERTKVYNLPSWAKKRGYMLVSVDYRPVPKTTIDGQVSDVVKAIRWVRANIARHGGDPSRIVLMGHSAGSHLVSMIGVRKLGGALRGIVANDVQAYDLEQYYRLRNNSMASVYRKAFGTSRANWRKWSPITYVGNGAGYPPFLILHSGSDGERRRALANQFADALRAKGTPVTVFDGSRYTHGSIARNIGRQSAVTSAVDAFLRRVFD
ncbi:MAG: alpha/beta hydrolase, partial [Pseudomonadota bacterium]|nr:alpha/beta hydrolase [Pseudomonadota bacterium]